MLMQATQISKRRFGNSIPSNSENGGFDDVARLHWRRIFQFVRQSVPDAHTAEDLTQDCFQNAYKGWKQFRGDCAVETWLRRIAANVVANFMRQKHVQLLLRAAPIQSAGVDNWAIDRKRSPESIFLLMEQVNSIWRSAKSASATQQTVLHLRFSKGMNLSEIAVVMGISDGAVKTHLFRAVRAVRKALRASPNRSRKSRGIQCHPDSSHRLSPG